MFSQLFVSSLCPLSSCQASDGRGAAGYVPTQCHDSAFPAWFHRAHRRAGNSPGEVRAQFPACPWLSRTPEGPGPRGALSRQEKAERGVGGGTNGAAVGPWAQPGWAQKPTRARPSAPEGKPGAGGSRWDTGPGGRRGRGAQPGSPQPDRK